MKQHINDAWIERADGNRTGTLFFQRIIDTLGIFPAYGMLFFAAWQYAFFDRKAVDAIRDFRAHLGLPTTNFDLYRHFYSFGMTLIDRYAFLHGKGAKVHTVHDNEAWIVREVERGKGVILLGAHVGNWEFAGDLLVKRIKAKVHIFMYDTGTEGNEASEWGYEPAASNLIIHPLRDAASDTAVEIINTLRSGEIVCIHGDRFFGGQRTETLDFFGKPARFPAGPMAIAAITGASVIPCFTVRTAMRRYAFSAEAPVHVEPGHRNERDERIRMAMRYYIDVLEKICRIYPRQWYNFYHFWQLEH